MPSAEQNYYHEVAAHLASSEIPDRRLIAANSPNSPLEILTMLAEDTNEQVKAAAKHTIELWFQSN